MAKDELRVAGILSVCTMAAIAGVVWGQVIQPPTPPAELAREAEERLVEAKEIAEEYESREPPASQTENLLVETLVELKREEAEAREEEIPSQG